MDYTAKTKGHPQLYDIRDHEDITKMDPVTVLQIQKDRNHTDLLSRMIWLDAATSENAIIILKKAIQKYGRPAAILFDRGSQFYATKTEEKTKGVTLFEQFLAEQGIGQRLSAVRHPQTNGKIERFFRTVKNEMDWVEGDLERLMVWYN